MSTGERIERVKEQLVDDEQDALIVTGPEHSFYFSGFHAVSDGNYPVVVIPAEGDPLLVVSPLDEDAAAYASSIDLRVSDDGFTDAIQDALPDDADVFITGNTTVSFYDRMADDITLTVNDDIVSELRRIKSDDEIDRMRNAYQVAEQALTAVTTQLAERGGTLDMTETEAAAEIEYVMRKHGARGAAFPTIVATGASASIPHHTTSDTVLGEGPLLFDIGATVDWYCSDISRTYHVAEPSEQFQDVYNYVREAQEQAADTLAPGVAAEAVDAAARNVLEDAGYGDDFTHSTGHGVGLSVHEAPNLSPRSDAELEDGTVVTVEPGVYIKGAFGVRIEDAYVVTENSAERLSTLSRDLNDMIIRT